MLLKFYIIAHQKKSPPPPKKKETYLDKKKAKKPESRNVCFKLCKILCSDRLRIEGEIAVTKRPERTNGHTRFDKNKPR